MTLRSKTALLISSMALMTALPAAAQTSDHTGHKMAGHDMQTMEHGRSAHMVEALATVTAILPDDNRISLSHNTIPAVSWPAATMKFPVTGGIDVTAFKPGDRVQFTLHRAENGSLPLVELCQTTASDVQPGLCAGTAKMAGHDMSGMDHGEGMSGKMDHTSMGHGNMDHGSMDHSAMDHSKMNHSKMDHAQMDHSDMNHSQMSTPDVSTTGTVLRIDTAARGLRIKHDPIPEIGWPVMTMQFEVAEAVNLTGLATGDAISFDFNPEAEDGYVISAIRPVNKTPRTTQSEAPDHNGHKGH